MPFAVSITKRTPFQGMSEEFSNVYQYGGPTPSEEDASLIIDYLADAEKSIFGNSVVYLTGFLYEIGGTPAENLPILRKDLAGTGLRADVPAIYREAAVMVYMRSTRPSALGRPVYFRKWLHTCAFDTTGQANAVIGGSQELSTAYRTEIEAWMEDVASPTVNGVEYVMASANGGIAQTPATCFRYLEHRQFPEGTKENGTP